jgi:hypothetical protein
MVKKIVISLQKDGEGDMSVTKIRKPFGVQTLFHVMDDQSLYGKGPHLDTATWFEDNILLNSHEKTESVLLNRKIGPGSVHKKPSIFLVCFQTNDVRENTAQ